MKNIKVEDLMDRVFVKFKQDTPVRMVVETLDNKRLFGACVVDEEDRVLGIVSERKCIKLYQKALATRSVKPIEEATVKDVMYDDFSTIEKTAGVVRAAEIFIGTDFRRMPVVESGKLVGQITRRDILRAIELFSM